MGAVLCAGLVLASCGDDEPATEAAAAVDVAHTPVTLLSAGSAPLEPLAWFTDPGEQKVTFEATQGLEQTTVAPSAATPDAAGATDTADTTGAAGPTSATSATNTDGASNTKDSQDKSSKDYDLPYEEVTMSLPLTATVNTDGEQRTTTVTVGDPTGTNRDRNEDIASAKGFAMTTTYGPDGQATQRSMAAPEAATNSARASVESALNQMNDFPVVFPTEPIGVGATWTVRNRVEAGVSMFQDITYTLLSRQGQNVTVKVDVERSPAVTSYGQTALTVMDTTTEASGQIQVDLTKAVPTAGHINVTTSMTLGEQGSDVRVIQKATTRGQWLASS